MGSPGIRATRRRHNRAPEVADVAVSKITRPLLAGSFPRTRLFRLLDECRTRPAVWVSGPPGCGKTTLVADYVGERALPCLWYDLDEGDNDEATFFYYLALAANKANPRRRAPLPVLTPEHLPALSLFARRYFETLYLRMRPSSVVVFDNYQRLSAGSSLHIAIRDASASVPRGMNIILISRNAPPPAFARLRAGRMLASVGWESLRLTLAETEGIARRRPTRGRAESARRLHSRTDGWAAGIVLLLEAPAAGNAPRRTAGAAPEEVFDYFAGEVFDRLDEGTRGFLLRTAFLPRMTARIAERLTGERRARQVLASLNRGNLFIVRHSGAEPVYAYHSLFGEYLRGLAEDALAPAELARLRRSAAAILDEAGQIEDAAVLLRDAGDRDGLARAVRKQAASLMAQGRSRTLLEWLGALPPEKIRADPWLLYWMGACRLPFDPTESRACFDAAFRRFDAEGNARGAFLAWAGVVDAIVYGPEGLKPLDPWLSALGNLKKKYARFRSEEIDARVTCAMIKGLSLRRPPSADMGAWADRALAVSRTVRAVPAQIELLTNLAYCHFHGGDFLKTVIALDSLTGLVREPGVSPLARLTVGWVEAAHANMLAQYGRARRVVSEGLALARNSGVHIMDYMLSGHGALAALHAGDFPPARDLLRKMASGLGTAKPWEASFFHFVAGWEALQRGDIPRAALCSEQGLAFAEDVGNPWTIALARLQRALVMHARGERGAADGHLAKARGIGARSGMRFILFACLLAEAYLLLERGEEAKGLSRLREGLAIGREKGYATLYLWHPRFAQTVAARALEAGIETAYVEKLILLNRLRPDAALSDTERWPWQLKIYTLGRFEVLLHGKPVPTARKVQQKPLLMLKALIALGGRDVPEERLTDILWPDSEGDLAHQSFATTLRRLRKLLGDPSPLEQRQGRLTLDNRSCWVDSWSFARIVSRIDEAGRGDAAPMSPQDHALLLERGVAMYYGPFLAAGPAYPWAESLRERLRGKFLRCVSELGRLRELAGEWDRAATCYRRGLERDDVVEEFYIRLMACLKAQGRTAEAIMVFERCRKTLSTVMGIDPSPEAEALRRSLQGD